MSRKMHLVYPVALHNPSPRCTLSEKHSSGPVGVLISADIIEHYVIGLGGPWNPGRWGKHISKLDAVGSRHDTGIEGACLGNLEKILQNEFSTQRLEALGFRMRMLLNWGLTRRGFGNWRVEAACCLKRWGPEHLVAQLC